MAFTPQFNGRHFCRRLPPPCNFHGDIVIYGRRFKIGFVQCPRPICSLLLWSCTSAVYYFSYISYMFTRP